MKHETCWVNRRNVQTCTKGLSSNKSQNSTELIRHIYALYKKNKMLWWWLPMLFLLHNSHNMVCFIFCYHHHHITTYIFPTALLLLQTHESKCTYCIYIALRYYKCTSIAQNLKLLFFCNNITSTFPYNFDSSLVWIKTLHSTTQHCIE